MEVWRVILERLLPEVWEKQQTDEAYKIMNCQTLHYSRRDPLTQ
jgi:hypothetical protein